MIWIKIKKEYLNTNHNFIIGGVYNSPINSSYTKRQDKDLFVKIQNKLQTFPLDEYIIIGGDFNARVGNMQYFIEESDEEKALLNLPENYIISRYKKVRCNQDQHKNTFGEKLIDMATSTNLKILNGRIIGDLSGRYTYIGYNGLSTVDYVLGSENLLNNKHVHSFEVEKLTIFSDHRPTCLTLQYDATKKIDVDTNGPSILTKPKKNKISINNYDSYKTELQQNE